MRVLIIGGTGLISTAITNRLLRDGTDVVHLNRGKTSPRYTGGTVDEIHIDRHDPSFPDALKGNGPYDVVIDMCAYHPDEVRPTLTALAGVTTQYIFCSTVDVYGKPAQKFPITEAEPLTGHTEYAKNKIACEELVMQAEGFERTVVRPSCTYGEGGVVIHTFGWGTWFLSRLEQGLPVVVFGDGTGIWTWCHVDDMAVAFTGACLNPAAYGQRFHAASDELLTWNASVETIARAVGGAPPTLVHIPIEVLHMWAPEHSQISWDNFAWPNFYDSSLAESITGFRTTVPFDVGVKRTVDWLRDHRGFEPVSADPITAKVLDRWAKAMDQSEVTE